MKMSVSKRLGFVQVRGGRVVVVSNSHEVPTSSYNRVPDAARGRQQPRVFDSTTMTARIGDLAVEIVGAATKRLLGFGYLSGSAINLCRYVDDGDRDQVLGWMTVGSGIRFSLPDPSIHRDEAVEAVRKVTCGGTDVAVAQYEVTGPMEPALHELSRVFESARSPDDAPTTDVLIKVTARASRQGALTHFQIPRRAQEEACQPFFHELLYSSPWVAS